MNVHMNNLTTPADHNSCAVGGTPAETPRFLNDGKSILPPYYYLSI